MTLTVDRLEGLGASVVIVRGEADGNRVTMYADARAASIRAPGCSYEVETEGAYITAIQ